MRTPERRTAPDSEGPLSGAIMNSYTSEAAETENRSTRIAAFTLFASSTETIGKLARSTFKDLAAKLTAPQLAGSDQTKETLPMISFAEFTGNRRAKDNIIRVHALVLDYDNEHEVETDERDPQDIRRRLKRKEALPLERRVAPETALNVFDGLEACAYSSWSHSSELTKFRLIVPFSRAVTSTEWERVTRWARSQLAKADHVVDPASWSAAQAWYRPRRREGQDFIGIHREGRPLDVDAVLRHVPEETTVSERPTRWTGTRLSAYANALNAAVSMPVLLRELGIEVSKAGFVNLRGERTDSAKVYDDHVHDFGSHETFYPVTLTAKTKGITYRAALEWLANFVGFEPFDWATSGLPEKVDPTEEINALPAELPATGWADTVKHAVAAISTQDDTDIAHWVRVLVAKYGKAFPGKASEVERLVRAHVREAKEARKAAAPATATTPEYTFDENGWLCEVVTNHQLGVVNRPLANFTATIERVVTYEDEITPRTVFVVAGKLSTGGGAANARDRRRRVRGDAVGACSVGRQGVLLEGPLVRGGRS